VKLYCYVVWRGVGSFIAAKNVRKNPFHNNYYIFFLTGNVSRLNGTRAVFNAPRRNISVAVLHRFYVMHVA